MMQLAVPGSEEHLGVLRTVVGRAAMMAGFSFDGIEDIALAVHEAAALLLLSEPQRVLLAVWTEEGALSIELCVESTVAPWPSPQLEDDVRWHLLTALSERVWLLDGQPGIGISQPRR